MPFDISIINFNKNEGIYIEIYVEFNMNCNKERTPPKRIFFSGMCNNNSYIFYTIVDVK